MARAVRPAAPEVLPASDLRRLGFPRLTAGPPRFRPEALVAPFYLVQPSVELSASVASFNIVAPACSSRSASSSIVAT